MELFLAKGWQQVAPRETPFDLMLSGQTPGQRLVATDTAFRAQRDLGYSGGANCPLAVDAVGGRVFASVDGIVSFETGAGEGNTEKIAADVLAVWLLEYLPDGPALMMQLSRQGQSGTALAWLDLQTGALQECALPKEAFFPMALSPKKTSVLYSAGQGAVIYDVTADLKAAARIDLPFQPLGAYFDPRDGSVVVGGERLIRWDPETGMSDQLCDVGSYPVLGPDHDTWFSLRDGALAKLRDGGPDFDIVVELTGLEAHARDCGSYAQPIMFSPDGQFGLVQLTGRTALVGEALEEAEAFCRRVGQPFTEFYRHAHHHYLCVLDLRSQEVWCHEGYAHNVAWVRAAA